MLCAPVHDLKKNSDTLKPGRDPDGYFFHFFISTFYFLITINILKFRHELPELHIISAYRPKRLLKGISNWISLYSSDSCGIRGEVGNKYFCGSSLINLLQRISSSTPRSSVY